MKCEAMMTQTQKEGNEKGYFVRKSVALFMVVMALACSVCAVSAAETQTIVDSTAYSSLFDILTAQLNVQSIVGVIAAILGVCVGLVFLWWGARKALSMLMAAFKRGKVSI